MKQETTDEYSNVSLGVCIIRKSTSVTKYLIDEWGISLLAAFISAIAVLAIIILITSMISLITEVLGNTWAVISTINPLIVILVIAVLSIPAYSTVWCIRHRKVLREKKIIEETPVCPIDEIIPNSAQKTEVTEEEKVN
jgi:hypothetical protein